MVTTLIWQVKKAFSESLTSPMVVAAAGGKLSFAEKELTTLEQFEEFVGRCATIKYARGGEDGGPLP